MRRELKKTIYFILGMLIFFFLFLQISKYWSQLNIKELDINYAHLAGLSLFILFYFVFNSFIWIRILSGCGQDVKLFNGIIIHVYSQAAKYLPGGMWNVVGRIYLCTKQGMSSAIVSTSVFLEILLNIIAGFILVITFGYSYLSLNVYILSLIFCFIVVLFYRPQIYIKPIQFIYSKWKKESISIEVSRKSLIIWSLYFLLSWLIYGITFYWFITTILGIDLTFSFALYTLIFSWIVGFISPIPGGLGVREGSMALLLNSQIPYAEALLISLFSRLWLIVVEFFMYLITYIVAKSKNVSLAKMTE